MKMIDAMGMPCPIPVIETKKALARQDTLEVSIKVDNIIAVQNLEKMASGFEYSFSFEEVGAGSYMATIRKKPASPAEHRGAGATPSASVTDLAELPAQAEAMVPAGLPAQAEAMVPAGLPAPELRPGKGLVVLIASDKLGSGSEELGKILIKGFIYSLAELKPAPTSVIFINRGAYLTAMDSNAVHDLETLLESGSEVLTCGTCSNYYGLTDKLAVGSIADMFKIVERMAGAGSVVSIC